MSYLQQDIKRTISSCDNILECFSDWSQWHQTTPGQRKLLHRALDGTITHLEDSLSKVELQIRNAANRGDSQGLASWDRWRAQMRQKRNALLEISVRLPLKPAE